MGAVLPEAVSTELARQRFRDLGLTYADVHEGDVWMLEGMMAEMMRRTRIEPATPVQSSWRPGRRARVRLREDGSVESCFLFVDAHYFEDRELVSFNANGFIGLCGWADSKNTAPIVSTFVGWCEDLASRRRAERGAA